MPFRWSNQTEEAPASTGALPSGPAGAEQLRLWPNRSLSNPGFATFFAATGVMLLVPLVATLGTPVVWAVLPFMCIVLALQYFLIRRNDADGHMFEELTLKRDSVSLVREDPRGSRREWRANPYWVRVALHETGGPVEAYVTLSGAGREVEIGAFLSPGERRALFDDLSRRLPAH